MQQTDRETEDGNAQSTCQWGQRIITVIIITAQNGAFNATIM